MKEEPYPYSPCRYSTCDFSSTLIFVSLLQDRNISVDLNSEFSEFSEVVTSDSRSFTLDPGNIKMTFNHVSSEGLGGEVLGATVASFVYFFKQICEILTQILHIYTKFAYTADNSKL